MMYNLRKRNAVNYDEDIVYERIFAECDNDVKECIFEDVEDNESIFEDIEDSESFDDEVVDYLLLKMRVKEGLLKIAKANGTSEKISKSFLVFDDAVLLINLYENGNPELSKFREVVVAKLNDFILEVPEHKQNWMYYLNQLQDNMDIDIDIELPIVKEKCECGETSMFGYECGGCFLQKQLSTRLCIK